jgi:hypothetical protein
MDGSQPCYTYCLLMQAVRRHAGKAPEFSYLPCHNKSVLLNLLQEALLDFTAKM